MLLAERKSAMSTQPFELSQPVIPSLVPAPARFLMCPPTLYDVSYVINPWMAGNVNASSLTRAIEQWNHLYNAVSRIAEVQLIEPAARLTRHGLYRQRRA